VDFRDKFLNDLQFLSSISAPPAKIENTYPFPPGGLIQFFLESLGKSVDLPPYPLGPGKGIAHRRDDNLFFSFGGIFVGVQITLPKAIFITGDIFIVPMAMGNDIFSPSPTGFKAERD